MYDRSVAGRELNFEASGALLDAALVMRDRETDSWWSIMTSDAIGGLLEGADLEELPVGTKTTWGAWRAAHPDTKVLSIEGAEHVANNPYDNYFTSEETFRGLEVDDDRLPAKEPVYTFRLDGEPYAAPHDAFEGGRVFPLGDEAGGRAVFLHRPEGAHVFASTEGWLLPADKAAELGSPEAVRRWLDGNPPAAEKLAGFDTYWYTWVAVNEGSTLLAATDPPDA